MWRGVGGLTAGTPISRSTVVRSTGTVRSERSALRCSKPQTDGGPRGSQLAVASPLLVILHYLLKSNTTFMALVRQGKVSLPLHTDCYLTGEGRLW